jgi:uncharacterized protein (DUF427 family)
MVMAEKTVKIPGPDHPITVVKNPDRVVVKVGDRVIADTRDALSLQEATYPAVQYIPRADVDFTQLQRTDHETYCPYKGDASYYSLVTADGTVPDAVWTYTTPYDAVGEIAGHVAFYPQHVDLVETAA